jgi:hypothetical protein
MTNTANNTAPATDATETDEVVAPGIAAIAATDEAALVTAVAAAGWPGRNPAAVIAAARAAVGASKLAASAAEDKLADAAAKAAGATGLASHDRDRFCRNWAENGGDVAKAAADAVGDTDKGAARARSLVWYGFAIVAAEAE